MTTAAALARPRIDLDTSQQAAIGAMQRGDNVFLTGNAGTGKSTVVTTFLGQAFRRIDVTATTGVAALNLRDQFQARSGIFLPVSTVFRWAGIALGPNPGENDRACLKRLTMDMRPSRAGAWRRVRAAECLVIDEISMLNGRVFQFLEFLCRELRGGNKPWGGLQVICVGDFLQLPPVARDGVYDWAFQSETWAATGFRSAVLTQIHRQLDPEFMGLLNAVRCGRVGGQHVKTLARRVARFPATTLLRLFTHNTQVDRWNTSRLEAIEAEQKDFLMTDTGGPECEWIKKNLLTPERLCLKLGARVMVTINLPDDRGNLRAVNGSLGTVIEMAADPACPCEADEIVLRLDDSRTIGIERFTWNVDPARPDAGGVTQFPLRLAWAATIHKSQGLSLDAALIDARATREPGQTYTALSRVRTLGGLWLRDTFTGVWVSPEAIQFMEGLG
jgi:ATP-dependent DNA helicase PIF1